MGLVQEESKQKSSIDSKCSARSREACEQVRGNTREKEGEHDLRHLPPGVLNHYLTHANLLSSQPNTLTSMLADTENF